MSDRSITRMDRALRLMRDVGQVPERRQAESFRRYFQRAAPPWLAEHAADRPSLAGTIEGLLLRDARRHPQSGQHGRLRGV